MTHSEPNHAGRRSEGERSVVTVVIVEDHAMVAEGLAAALGEDGDIDVVAIASTAQQAEELIREMSPDVALVDFRLPDGDGTQLTAAIKRGQERTQVILLTAADDHEVLARAIEAGAAGFVHKSEPIEEVTRAIRAVQAGEPWFRPEVLAELVGTIRRPARAVGDDLTAREREVLTLLAEGASTQAMIDTLVLSPHTVRNHVRNIMTKLGTHSKLEAVTVAARAGIVSLGTGPGSHQHVTDRRR